MKIYSKEDINNAINYIKEKYGKDLIAYIDNPIKRGFDKLNIDNIEILSEKERNYIMSKVNEALNNKNIELVDNLMNEISNKTIEHLSFFNIDCDFVSLLTLRKQNIGIIKENYNDDIISVYLVP